VNQSRNPWTYETPHGWLPECWTNDAACFLDALKIWQTSFLSRERLWKSSRKSLENQ